MRSLLLRSLVLGCGLLLALPPGWCCLPACQGTPKEQPRVCTCCGGEEPGNPPARQPRPAPAEPGKCPCAGRDSTVPDGSKVFGCDLSLPAPLAAARVLLCRVGPAGVTDVDHPPPGPPLQLLHCVWGC
jgi:hypothetical protein